MPRISKLCKGKVNLSLCFS